MNYFSKERLKSTQVYFEDIDNVITLYFEGLVIPQIIDMDRYITINLDGTGEMYRR